MMKDQELFRFVVRVLEEHFADSNSSSMTVEEEMLEILRSHHNLSSQEVVFALDCVVNVCRFEKLCKGAFEGYCDAYKRNKKGRFSIYLMTYILFFKYNELGGEKVRSFIHQPELATRIVEYIRYLLDLNAVQRYSFPGWLQYYDIHFIEKSVLEPFFSRKINLESEVLMWFNASSTTLRGAVHQNEDEERKIDTVRGLKQSEKVRLNMQMIKSGVHINPETSNSPRVPNEARPHRDASHQSSKLEPDKSSTKNITRSMQPPTLVELSPKQVLFSQSSRCRSNTPKSMLPRVEKKLPTRPIVFSFLRRSSTPSPPLPDAVGKKSESTNSLARITAFYTRTKACAPAKVLPTTGSLRREAYLHEAQKQEAPVSLLEREESFHDSVDYKLCTIKQCQRIAQENESKILQRHLEALECEEKMRQAKVRAIAGKKECANAMKKQAAVDASERQKNEQADAHQQQDFVRTFRAQLVMNKNMALERCNSNKQRKVNEVKEERSQIREAAQKTEEQRRLERSQMIHDIRLIRVRIKQRKKELACLRCAGRFDHAGEPTSGEGCTGGRGGTDVQGALTQVRALKREAEEILRHEIAAAHEREREERQNLEQMVEAQRQTRFKERERERELKRCREEKTRGVIEAYHASRVLDMYEKLHTRRLKQLWSQRELREEERKCRNERILRNASSGAIESERWRQLEQGLHTQVLSSQNFRKSCTALL